MSAKPANNPPGLRWDLTAEEIKKQGEELIEISTKVLDKVAAASPATFETVILPLMTLDRDLEAKNSSAVFVKNVSTDKGIRDAAAATQAALSAFEVKAGMRLDVYQSVNRYVEAAEKSGELKTLDKECARFVERTMRDFRRRGLHLDEVTRKKVELLQTRISDLCVKYQQNVAEENTVLLFTADDLRGMPEDFVASLKEVGADEAKKAVGLSALEEGAEKPKPVGNADAVKAAIASGVASFKEATLSYPHVIPLLKLASVPATRKAVEKAFNSRAVPANVQLLEEIVQLRRYNAFLLGYKTHAAYVLEEKMAKDEATVNKFLSDLARDLKPLRDADIRDLTALKHKEEGPDSGPLLNSDRQYYSEQELKDKYSVDHNAVKEYYPLNVVLPAMLSFYENLFGVRFELQDQATTHKWHEEVQLYTVTDSETNEALGFFYFDLHPRPGKYSHAAVFPLISGCEDGPINPTGSSPGTPRILPTAACVCNFPKGAEGKPSFLRHDDVVTTFHEFGHVVHHLLSKTRLFRFASFRVEGDFVECPSQMLENFVWLPATAPLLSGKADNSAEKLPADLVDKLYASKTAHAGLFNSRQVMLATLDMRLHTMPAVAPPDELIAALEKGDEGGAIRVDTSEVRVESLLKELHDDIMGIPWTPSTNFAASFGHLCGGYDAGYYGYLWSEVYSADLFDSAFGSKDPLSKEQGRRYRRHILQSGGSEDAAVFLREFLGREPTTAAFLKSKGLGLK